MSTPEVKRMKLEEGKKDSKPTENLQELMPLYYARLFPFKQMHKWLAYGSDSKHTAASKDQQRKHCFSHREFCFTLQGDIFVRYQSFKDSDTLQEAVKAKLPTKIDIGPVYNWDPRDRVKYQKEFTPVERELVFDIDLTDYDDVRTCGKEGHICSKCWPFMAAAVEVLDAALREDFGFENVFWVYSGRRGVHCWVCDSRARQLKDSVRGDIVQNLTLYKGVEKDRAKVAVPSTSLHPSVARAQRMLRNAWIKHVLPAQQLLERADKVQQVLQYVPDEALAQRLKQEWAAGRTGSRRGPRGSGELNEERWLHLEEECLSLGKAAEKNKQYSQGRALQLAPTLIIFAFCYPRLDVEVSKKMNHLLKAPFCVHPKTGKVCVPIQPQDVWSFEPDDVPTVQELVQQLEQVPVDATRKGEEWRATRMAEAVDAWQASFLDGLQQAVRRELQQAAQQERITRVDVAW